MYYDLLLHIDLNEQQRLDIALSNIKNYLVALPHEKYSVILLANSSAVQLLTKTHIDYFEKFQFLVDKGVVFRVCANAIMKFGIAKEDLFSFCTVTPAGIVEIVQLQREGFVYIKP